MCGVYRLNSLTRDAEVEAAYWDSMRNTNHHSSVHSGKNSWKAELNKAEEVAATTTAATPPHPQRGAQHASVSTQGPGGVQRGVQRSGQAKSSGAGGITKSVDGDRIGQSQPQQQKQQGKQQGKQQPSAGTGPKEGRNPSSNKQKDGDAGQSVDGSVASGDSSKKHRSKPFDKHHQKDRAIRKFSHFAPSS